jgi:hypothetical protein
LGLGVMLAMMGGNEKSVNAFLQIKDKKIAALALENDDLIFTMEDGAKAAIYDGGQSCCEERYMHTDDDLQAFVGATLISAEVRDAPDIEDDRGEVHEVAFLIVTTSLGAFTVETHNEHNGYYGGFAIMVRTLTNAALAAPANGDGDGDGDGGAQS